MQEPRSDEEFQHLLTKVKRLVGVISLDVASAAKRKRETPSSISDFVAYSYDSIEPINMGERNALHANLYGALDTKRQAIKDCFDQEDLKQLITINKCLIDAASKETVVHVKDKLACISDLVK